MHEQINNMIIEHGNIDQIPQTCRQNNQSKLTMQSNRNDREHTRTTTKNGYCKSHCENGGGVQFLLWIWEGGGEMGEGK